MKAISFQNMPITLYCVEGSQFALNNTITTQLTELTVSYKQKEVVPETKEFLSQEP